MDVYKLKQIISELLDDKKITFPKLFDNIEKRLNISLGRIRDIFNYTSSVYENIKKGYMSEEFIIKNIISEFIYQNLILYSKDNKSLTEFLFEIGSSINIKSSMIINQLALLISEFEPENDYTLKEIYELYEDSKELLFSLLSSDLAKKIYNESKDKELKDEKELKDNKENKKENKEKLDKIIKDKDYKSFEDYLMNNDESISKDIPKEFLINFIKEDNKRIIYFENPIYDIRVIDLFINNINSSNFDYIIKKVFETYDVVMFNYLYEKYPQFFKDRNVKSLVDNINYKELVKHFEFAILLYRYRPRDSLIINILNDESKESIFLLKEILKDDKYINVIAHHSKYINNEKYKLLIELDNVTLIQVPDILYLAIKYNDKKTIETIINNENSVNYTRIYIEDILKTEEYKFLDILPRLFEKFTKKQLKEIAIWIYNYKEPYNSKYSNIVIEGKDIKERNKLRSEIRKNIEKEVTKYVNTSGRKQQILFNLFKSLQKQLNLSTIDLKYCFNKEDINLDPLDSKNELTVFQRYDSKNNKVYGECHNTEDIINLSEPSDMVYRWNPQKGNEDRCCALKDQRVIKLPLSGVWIIASMAMLKSFKYFQMISIGKQKIGSEFGVSALHNATEELWRCIPCNKIDIEKGFQEQKIIPGYSFHPNKEDLTVFDPMDIEKYIESKDIYCEIQILPTGKFNILVKEKSENKNLYKGLTLDMISSDSYEIKYMREYVPNKINIPQINPDECKNDQDCEEGYSCYDDACVKNEDLGLE